MRFRHIGAILMKCTSEHLIASKLHQDAALCGMRRGIRQFQHFQSIMTALRVEIELYISKGKWHTHLVLTLLKTSSMSFRHYDSILIATGYQGR